MSHIQGTEFVSISTQRSSRLLVTISIVVSIALFFKLDLEELTFLEISIPLSATKYTLLITSIFLIFNHLVNWFGDYRAREKWNAKDRVNGVARADTGSRVLTKLDKAIETIDELKNRIDNFPNQGLDGYLKYATETLNEIRGSNLKLRSYAGFVFYVWYGLLPLTVGLTAFALAFRQLVLIDSPP